MEKAVSSPAEPASSKASAVRQESPLTLQDGLAIGLITAFTVALRLLHLSARSLTLDEGFSVFLARTNFGMFTDWIWRSEFNMALYYLLLRMWLHVASNEFAVRLLSVLFAAATAPVIYLLGKRLFGRSAALMACLLFAVHPFQLELSQQARSYTLVVFLVSLSSLCFLRLVENASPVNCVVYAVISAAAMYSHFFAALVILAQWLSLLWLRPQPSWKALARSGVLLILLLVPIGLYLLHAQRTPVGWIPKANLRQALDVLYSLTLTKGRSFAYVAMWAIAFSSGLRRREQQAWPYQFAMAWLVMPLAVTGVAGAVQPLWIPRFLAICIPAAVLLAAAGITQLSRWSRAAGALILLVIVFYSGTAIRFYDRHSEFSADWRGAISYMLPRLQRGDQVVMDPYVRYTFDFYRQASSVRLPPLVMANSLSSPLARPDPPNVWTIASVLVNPDDPSSGPTATEVQVRAFLAAHETYCALPPQPEGASAEVWQLRHCAE